MKIKNVIKVEISNLEIEQLVIDYIKQSTDVGDTVPLITVDDNGITALYEVITIPTAITTETTDKPKRGRPKKDTETSELHSDIAEESTTETSAEATDTETFLGMIMSDEKIPNTQSPFAPALATTLDFSKLMG